MSKSQEQRDAELLEALGEAIAEGDQGGDAAAAERARQAVADKRAQED
jgi:hypothetical protein